VTDPLLAYAHLKPKDYKRIRRLAVQFLYQLDADKNLTFYPSIFQQFLIQNEARDIPGVDFLQTFIEYIIKNVAQSDQTIQKFAKNWTLERISRIDLAILRVGIAELQFRPGVEHSILISDAVKIADEFGAHQSAVFVNGLLDAIAKG